MYIITKYKDFYDSAVGMGIDKTIVYERKFRQEPFPKELKNIIDRNSNYSLYRKYIMNISVDDYETSLIYLGFCGKMYVGLKIIKKIKDYLFNETIHIEIIWDYDKIRKILKNNLKRKKYYWSKYQKTDLELFNNHISKIESADFTELFRKYNTPIFVFGEPAIADIDTWRKKFNVKKKNESLFINPILKEYQFAKVFDPYTAFQEIQMYVSGVLGINKDGTEIPATEKQKVAQHGMDKWSFRKEPKK